MLRGFRRPSISGKDGDDVENNNSMDYIPLNIMMGYSISEGLGYKKERTLSSIVFEKYSVWTKNYYLFMAFLQSGIIACAADIFTQKMEGAVPIDYAHVLALLSVAAIASGWFNALLLRRIEAAYPGSGTKEVVMKAIISTLPLGGAINAMYLIGVPLLRTTVFAEEHRLPPLDADIIFQGWTVEKFITLTKIECIMFLPYHSLAFKMISLQWRPVFQAGMAGVFSIAVSAVTLGYFNIWWDILLDFFAAPITR